MNTKNQVLLKNEINQMNMNFVIKIIALSTNATVMTRMKLVTERVSEHLQQIDQMFSPFRYDSMVSRFQRGDQEPLTSSNEFKEIYNSAVLSEQMTNGIYRPYFAGRFDPSDIVRNWAIEQVFNDDLKPLLQTQDIVAIYFSGDDNAKFATKQGVNYRWEIEITDPQNKVANCKNKLATF
ncbi:FAD:protein FMN transferase [Companilactobacillus huachuanensis]|uniref:FAD:protein FMN transferase n=1 Tax=Companilactobacillus huachuanensis TaxID=2559914 RepID=A0ABW1RPF5_9LACO|nr:FAD:protein FMN transferase [Companilactobacillus huachuanensis]